MVSRKFFVILLITRLYIIVAIAFRFADAAEHRERSVCYGLNGVGLSFCLNLSKSKVLFIFKNKSL